MSKKKLAKYKDELKKDNKLIRVRQKPSQLTPKMKKNSQFRE
jgi:hypothetical protein